MKPTFYQVHPALRNYVSHIMVLEAFMVNNNHTYSPYPPAPQHCINFYPGDPILSRKVGDEFARLPDAVIVGPQTTRVDLIMGKHHIILSVAFHPGGMFKLLKIPMYELMDAPFNGEDILGRDIREVNEKLLEAKTMVEMKDVVEAYLLAKLKPADLTPFERSMKAMLLHKHNITMDEAASISCLSNRQFERKAKEAMGYSPKFFARLIRFSAAYRMKVNQQKLSWGTIGHANGYFDQAHLIKDFKEFTATNPKMLAQEILRSQFQVQDDLKI